MPPTTLPFATPSELEDVRQMVLDLKARCDSQERELAQGRAFQKEFIASLDDQVPTKKAQEITGIKTRATLIAKRQQPDSLLSYTVNGRSVTYSRAGCVAYKLARQIAA